MFVGGCSGGNDVVAEGVLAGQAGGDPSFVAQYAPIIGALFVFTSAMLTLYKTGQREEKRRRKDVLDDYNREQRVSIAAVATAAHEFSRTAAAFGDSERLIGQGHEPVTRAWDAADGAAAALINAVTVARLLVRDATLAGSINALFEAFEPMHETVVAAYYAYCDQEDDSLRAAAAGLQGLWADYDQAVVNLQKTALLLLSPSVEEDRGSGD